MHNQKVSLKDITAVQLRNRFSFALNSFALSKCAAITERQ